MTADYGIIRLYLILVTILHRVELGKKDKFKKNVL